MTEKEFNSFIKESISDLPIHKQEELLHRIQYKWVPKLCDQLSNTISRKQLMKCDHCHKYSPKKNYSLYITEEFVKDVQVFVDAGYGDDDAWADVKYLAEYYVCPCCKKKIIKHRTVLSQSKWRRRGE